jgi:hypothetical protein
MMTARLREGELGSEAVPWCVRGAQNKWYDAARRQVRLRQARTRTRTDAVFELLCVRDTHAARACACTPARQRAARSRAGAHQ